MKRLTSLLILWFATLAVIARTTYIPSYSGFIKIGLEQDTIRASSIFDFTELTSQNGYFRVTIEHEKVDEIKIKAIKRAKMASGWALTAAILSGVSAGLNTGRTHADLMNYVNDLRTYDNSVEIAKLAKLNATAEQVLSVNFVIENLTDDELMVSDTERGLTWYILPHEYLSLNANNPDVAFLRVAKVIECGRNVSRVTLCAGSSVRKWNTSYEDEECWIKSEIEEYPGRYGEGGKLRYIYKNKETFEEKEISYEEYKALSKKEKKK